MTGASPPFAVQRIVCLSLLGGIAMYTVVVAVLLQGNDGKGLGDPVVPILDQIVIWAGAGVALAAFTLRAALMRAVDAAPPAERRDKRFVATLLPLAMLEGGAMLGITVWLINGTAVPNLVTAMVLFAAAILVVPLRDPEERAG